jgi:hypothetical protein
VFSGASLGYLGLLLVLTTSTPASVLRRLYGLLLPLFALMVVGLTFDDPQWDVPWAGVHTRPGDVWRSVCTTLRKHDPVAVVFSLAPQVFEQIAFPVFVLNTAVADLWGTFSIKDPAFFIFLNIVAYLFYVLVRDRWVTLRARWVTLRARWVTLRARW